jgi:hypothetical protein
VLDALQHELVAGGEVCIARKVFELDPNGLAEARTSATHSLR